jgi:hypothetical protein
MVLDEIVLQLGMRGRVFNFEICLKKCLDEIGVPLGPHSASTLSKKNSKLKSLSCSMIML